MENNDYYFNSTAALSLGSAGKKFQSNFEAIKILKACQAENRPATPDEQTALSLYTGWGDSAVLRTLLYDNEGRDLRQLLTWEEMRAVKGSSLNAHYTALPVIGAIWDGVMHMGAGQLPELRIIDPSAGIGHFKSCTPEALRSKANWVEVELDQLTAGILSLLHPGSTVHQKGYEKVNLPSGWFDLAISNVPFGDYGVNFKSVPAFVRSSIHNFFFGRTVSVLRPGGVMAFITSRYTMDSKDSLVRTWLATYTDFLAAVRLPDTSFKVNAGTEVVTDIIFLRKRANERTDTTSLGWIESEPCTVRNKTGEEIEHYINEYFIRNPHMVMGEPTAQGTMYSGDNYTVKARDGVDLGEAISQALCSALPAGLLAEQSAPVNPAPAKRKVVTITSLTEKTNPEVVALLGIFNAAKELLTADAEGALNAEDLRDTLNKRYNEFTARHGPVSANLKAITGTPEAAFLRALELDFDPVPMTARKAGLFFSPVIRSSARIAVNPTPADALVISLEQIAKVDMAYICAGTGMDIDQVREALKGVIYQTPTGDWLTADEYLSGNVRAKLREAEVAASLDARFAENVGALRAVLPSSRTAEKIYAQLGSGWIPAVVIEDFINHLLHARYIVRYVSEMAHWEVSRKYKWDNVPSGLMHQKWGTGRCSAIDLIDDALNARIPTVYDVEPDETRTVNHAESVAAQAKQVEIREEFGKWLWSDETRKAELERIYNETFRSFVSRKYDGSHLAFPGLRSSIQLRPSQKDVAWRALLNKSTAMIHEVGMGVCLASCSYEGLSQTVTAMCPEGHNQAYLMA